jgi:sRNA-binding carbon storage regulator CsrA
VMLILKRNEDEIVDLYVYDKEGKEVKISIMAVETGVGWCRLGVDAPKDILILRREVPKRPQKEVN